MASFRAVLALSVPPLVSTASLKAMAGRDSVGEAVSQGSGEEEGRWTDTMAASAAWTGLSAPQTLRLCESHGVSTHRSLTSHHLCPSTTTHETHAVHPSFSTPSLCSPPDLYPLCSLLESLSLSPSPSHHVYHHIFV